MRGLSFYPDANTANTTPIETVYPARLEIGIIDPVFGEQDCGEGLTVRMLMTSQTTSDRRGNYDASTCKMRLDYASDIGGWQGVILSAKWDRDKNTSFEIVNTPFRIYHHVGIAGELGCHYTRLVLLK